MRIRRFLILWWMLATTLAVGVAAFVVELIPGRQSLVEGLSTGLIVGAVQWALLRVADERLNLWPLVTVAGWALVGLMTSDWPVWAGPWIGMLQWIALRRYTRDAGWWVIASATGWFVAWCLSVIAQTSVTRGLRASLVGMLGPDAFTSLPFYLVNALNWTLGAWAYGLITAVALAFVLEPEN